MKNNIKIWIETLIPLFLPIILSIPDEWMLGSIKWGIFILASLIYIYFALRKNSQKKTDELITQKNTVIKYAFSCAHEIIDKKRTELARITENIKKNNKFEYDVHIQIAEICSQFKHLISLVTKIDSSYITVVFIYKYKYKKCSWNDSQWKWIVGKEPTNYKPINEFVNNPQTTFWHIINGKDYYIFGNDKEELSKQGKYYISKRDETHSNVGSIFSIKVAFGNNKEQFVEGVISVSTYGVRFLDYLEISSNQLSNMIIDDIFPYYQKLIETELGILYLTHINTK